MLATPNVAHVSRSPFVGHVYDPAEDTFALLDALEQDAESIRQQRPKLVMEIGCGSGCVSAFVAQILDTTSADAAFICTDLNVKALDATRQTAMVNGERQFDVVQTTLLAGLLPRCSGHVDILLFNPPYVPTTDEEEVAAQSMQSIEGSWAGGTVGTKLVEKLLPSISQLLANDGRFYLVAISQNDPQALIRRLEHDGLSANACLARKAGREHLFIIRAIKKSTPSLKP